MGGTIYSPHSLEPFKTGLNAKNTTKLAFKLHAHSDQNACILVSISDALSKNLLPHLIIEVRSRALLVILLIPIDFFSLALGSHGVSNLGAPFPLIVPIFTYLPKDLIDVGRIFTAYMVFSFLSNVCSVYKSSR